MQAEEATEKHNSATAAASTTDETEEVSLVKPYRNGEVAQEPSLNVMRKDGFPIGRIKVLSEFLKAPSSVLRSISSSLRIPGTLLTVGLVIVVVGICGRLLF